MPSKRPVSAFDIIGPIMVGPSSSHTAGAVRLGLMGRAILGAQPQDVLIELHGSFAQTGRGHGTDRALVAGLLGMSANDDRIRHSLEVAAEQGMIVRFETVDLGEDVHPNSVRLSLQTGDRNVQITGDSVGGGMVEITDIDGYAITLTGEHETILVVANDRPGTINAVTGLLLERRVNVAFSRVERKRRGGEAIMVFETDDAIPAELLDALEDFYWVRWVRHIPKVTG
ncbi:MAG: L-serine ammonia-lyase, iron-sulfur-dependent subunit beta [Caldilineales bacterium]|nr:L-serine ammonia-lyase, iron-sulfur-dependent subunit beta [Caldilineales bacterium]